MKTTQEVVNRWQNAKQKVKNAEQALNRAECELTNAENALGKHLVPKSAAFTEKFCIWAELDDKYKLIEIEKVRENDYKVRWHNA